MARSKYKHNRGPRTWNSSSSGAMSKASWKDLNLLKVSGCAAHLGCQCAITTATIHVQLEVFLLKHRNLHIEGVGFYSGQSCPVVSTETQWLGTNKYNQSNLLQIPNSTFAIVSLKLYHARTYENLSHGPKSSCHRLQELAASAHLAALQLVIFSKLY